MEDREDKEDGEDREDVEDREDQENLANRKIRLRYHLQGGHNIHKTLVYCIHVIDNSSLLRFVAAICTLRV